MKRNLSFFGLKLNDRLFGAMTGSLSSWECYRWGLRELSV